MINWSRWNAAWSGFKTSPAMIEQRQSDDLADAFMEAYDRGPAWKEAIRKSLSLIDEDSHGRILTALADAVGKLGRDPAKFELGNAAST